jgi:hypothetical protein
MYLFRIYTIPPSVSSHSITITTQNPTSSPSTKPSCPTTTPSDQPSTCHCKYQMMRSRSPTNTPSHQHSIEKGIAIFSSTAVSSLLSIVPPAFQPIRLSCPPRSRAPSEAPSCSPSSLPAPVPSGTPSSQPFIIPSQKTKCVPSYRQNQVLCPPGLRRINLESTWASISAASVEEPLG